MLFRRIVTAAAGIACLAASALTAWYRIPEDFLPVAQLPFRLLVALASIWLAVALLVGKRPHLFLSGCLVVLLGLLYPHVQMVWDGPTAGKAAQLVRDANNLDVEIHKTYFNKEVPWDETVELSGVTKDLTVFHFTVSDARFFHPANLPAWLAGYGLGGAFFQFVGLGWVLALAGGLVLALGFFLEERARRPALSRRQLAVWLGAGGLAALLLLVPLVAANVDLDCGRIQAAQGFPKEAMESLRSALRWVPSLDYNSKLHSDLGAICHENNRTEEPEFHNFLGDASFHRGAFAMAKAHYERALEIRPDHPVSRRNLLAALLNLGIEHYNRGQFHSARDAWERVLEIEPDHLHALYNLAAAHITLENYDLAEASLRRVLELLSYFQLPPVALTSQCYMRLSWCEYRSQRGEMAWEFSRRAVDPSQWR